MDEFIVMFFSENNRFSNIENSLRCVFGTQVFFFRDFAKASVFLEQRSNPVTIVDMTDESNPSKALITLLKQKKQRYIVMCKTKQQVFPLVNDGAADFIMEDNSDFVSSVVFKARVAHNRTDFGTSRILKQKFNGSFNKIVVIGSSTGGTEAVSKIISRLPPDFPPVLLAQHMPEYFTELYARRLHNESKISVWEAKDGDALSQGLCLISPGKKQMELKQKNGNFYVEVYTDESNRIYKPSVDVLFRSVVKSGANAIGVILTGMGGDGAEGLLEMRKNGSFTIGQDEKSSVIYGMPKVAFEMGAVAEQADINDIADILIKNIR